MCRKPRWDHIRKPRINRVKNEEKQTVLNQKLHIPVGVIRLLKESYLEYFLLDV
jgi:hypothetical protein